MAQSNNRRQKRPGFVEMQNIVNTVRNMELVITLTEVQEFYAIFFKYTTTRADRIPNGKLFLAMRALGEEPTHDEARALIKEFNKKSELFFTFNNFVIVMARKRQNKLNI